jgi:hypothetical protein
LHCFNLQFPPFSDIVRLIRSTNVEMCGHKDHYDRSTKKAELIHVSYTSHDRSVSLELIHGSNELNHSQSEVDEES